MGIELAAALKTKTAEPLASILVSNAMIKEGSASFKEQLESSATQEGKSSKAEEAEKLEASEFAKIKDSVKSANVAKTAELTQQAKAGKVLQNAQIEKASTEKQSKSSSIEAQKTSQTEKTAVESETSKNSKVQETAITQKVQKEETERNNISEEWAKNKSTAKNSKDITENSADGLNPLEALSAKISTINELKNKTVSKLNARTDAISLTDKTTDKNDYGKILKMDKSDATFFLNLVTNQETATQSLQAAIANQSADNNFVQMKSAATQQSVQVSQVLIDALSDSAKTGKSVRIDFDNNIAVVMKLDKNGAISANFIPGDAAVENYLRNNIASLKQNFEDQNLAYNELTYTRQHKQEQQKQQKQNKENGNE